MLILTNTEQTQFQGVVTKQTQNKHSSGVLLPNIEQTQLRCVVSKQTQNKHSLGVLLPTKQEQTQFGYVVTHKHKTDTVQVYYYQQTHKRHSLGMSSCNAQSSHSLGVVIVTHKHTVQVCQPATHSLGTSPNKCRTITVQVCYLTMHSLHALTHKHK